MSETTEGLPPFTAEERDAARLSVPSEALAEAIKAGERIRASAIENGGRLTPGAILDVQGVLNFLAALPNREDAPDLISAIDRLLAVPHRDDEQPCSCDECMSYGAEDAGADWYRIPPANRIAMRILDGGDDRLAVIAAAFRDHEAAVREDAPSREGLDAAYTAIRAAIVQPDASLDTAYVPWRAIKAAFRGDREDRRPMISDTIFQLTSFTRHRPWCPEFSGPGDCTCGLYALLDSIRCTCGHKVSVHTNRDVSDVVGWPCIECKSARCHGFDLSSEEAAVTTAEAAAGEEGS